MRAARRFTRAFLLEHGLDVFVEDAELAVSEVATNALLHAQGPFHVGLSTDGRGLRAQVTDPSPVLPSQREAGTQATTGRGMSLLDGCTTDHGVAPLLRGKTVWFVLGEAPEADELAPEPAAPAAAHTGAVQQVRLPHFPADLWAAARQHHDYALLRQLVLHLAEHPDDALRDQLARCSLARRAVAAAVLGALAGPSEPSVGETGRHVDLELALHRDDGAAFAALQDVLDRSEELSRGGRLFAPPALPEVVALRDWVCEQVVAQLSGVLATAWPGLGSAVRDPAPVPAAGWDPEQLAASDVGVAVADESGRLVAVSRPLAAALGWAVGDLVGRRVVALVPPDLREAHVARFTLHTTTGASRVVGVPLRLPVLHADGSTVACAVLLGSGHRRRPAGTCSSPAISPATSS